MVKPVHWIERVIDASLPIVFALCVTWTGLKVAGRHEGYNAFWMGVSAGALWFTVIHRLINEVRLMKARRRTYDWVKRGE